MANKIDKTELFKSIYERECQRRTTLDNSISIPVAVISGLIAAIVFLTTNFDYSACAFYTIMFATLLTICIAMLFCSVFFLLKSFNNLGKGYDYEEIPLLLNINNHFDKLLEFNENDRTKTEVEFTKFIQNGFIKYADIHTVINDKRSFELYRSKKFLVYTLIALALLCIPYVLVSYSI